MRSSAQNRLTAVGRLAASSAIAASSAAWNSPIEPKVGRPDSTATPYAAAQPIAGAPRTTMSRIAAATSAAVSQATYSKRCGSSRWSISSSRSPAQRSVSTGRAIRSPARCRRRPAPARRSSWRTAGRTSPPPARPRRGSSPRCGARCWSCTASTVMPYCFARSASTSSVQMPVSNTAFGCSVLMRMPSAPHSSAATRASWVSAAFEAE